MKKICVIKTGGTIGSVADNGIVALDREKSQSLAGLFEGDGVEFVVRSEFSILSENLDFEVLGKISGMVKSAAGEDFDGIIVTHGTDTLAYTSCVLAINFSEISLPVVLVSANFPLENPKSNGKANFEKAVDFILSGGENGVFVAYQNPGESAVVDRGEKILGCWQKEGFFYSEKTAPSVSEVKEFFGISEISFNNPKRVLPIKAAAPCDFSVFNLDNCDVVVCETFHSGTVKTAGKNGVQTLISEAEKKNIPLILCGISNGDMYESMSDLHSGKTLHLFPGTFEMAFVVSGSGARMSVGD